MACIFRRALRRLDSPLSSVQRAARTRPSSTIAHTGFPWHATVLASHESVRGKCCECVTPRPNRQIHRTPVHLSHVKAAFVQRAGPTRTRRTTHDGQPCQAAPTMRHDKLDRPGRRATCSNACDRPRGVECGARADSSVNQNTPPARLPHSPAALAPLSRGACRQMAHPLLNVRQVRPEALARQQTDGTPKQRSREATRRVRPGHRQPPLCDERVTAFH